MFVNDADRFGLAQLHQLRGRIGRSNVRAYCYLLVKDPKRLQPDARRRLEVLQQHTELGAGIQIAQHDLDMRGAGNILGRDQSGHIEAIGFELYSELLQEAIADLKGATRKQDVEPDIKLPVPAYIAEDYVADVQQRLVFYKRYSMAASEAELFDVHAELQERYGPAPAPVSNLRDLVRLKIEMRAIGARKLEAGAKAVVVELLHETPLDPGAVLDLIKRSGGDYEFRPEMTVIRRLKPHEGADILASALRVSRELAACV
jgi:transcription-repair coupling factor (superfamily II helicase)